MHIMNIKQKFDSFKLQNTICFGAYGGSGMLDALRIVNGLFLTLSLSFSVLSLIGIVLPFYSCFSLPDHIERCKRGS